MTVVVVVAIAVMTTYW